MWTAHLNSQFRRWLAMMRADIMSAMSVRNRVREGGFTNKHEMQFPTPTRSWTMVTERADRRRAVWKERQMAHHLTQGLVPAGLMPPRAARRLAMQGSVREGQRQLAESAISDFAAVQHRRLQAAGCVGRAAMRQVALTCDVEGLLGRASPLAVTKLEGISNLIALGIAEVVQSTMERLSL
jgi:hypothetical protein